MPTTTISTLRDLTSAVRGRRIDLGMSQARLARAAGVSRQWVSEFESGKPTAELGLALRLLDALELRIVVGPASGGPTAPGRDGRPGVDLDSLLQTHIWE